MARRKVWGSVGCLVLMLILVCLHCETIAADAVTSDKPQAEMKLRLSAPTALWPTPPRPIRLRLAALGKQPKDTVWLIDAAGLNVATVTFPKSCAEVPGPVRFTGAGTDEWCVEIAKLFAGSDSTGTIKAEAMTLKLTAGVRHHWFLMPALVAVLSIALGIFTTWLSTARLPDFVAKKLVDDVLARNASRVPSERIGRLDEWVSARRQSPVGAMDNKALLPIVRDLLAYGPREARAAREALRQVLDGPAPLPLPAQSTLVNEAETEASRATHSIQDFYKSDGTKVDRHPATELLNAIERAMRLTRRLDRAAGRINGIKPPEQQERLRPLLKQRQDLLNTAHVADLDNVERSIDRLDDEIDRAQMGRSDTLAMDTAQSIAVVEHKATRQTPAVAATAGIVQMVERLQVLLPAGISTSGAVAIVAFVAVLTAISSSYYSKETFGTWTDYLALFLSGFGSSAISGILATLLLWRKPATP